jgi:hypothetical protein
VKRNGVNASDLRVATGDAFDLRDDTAANVRLK